MNPSFLQQEVLMAEYRQTRMAEAAKHNQAASLSESKATLIKYWLLAKIGEQLENTGCKMRKRYEKLALRTESNAIFFPAK